MLESMICRRLLHNWIIIKTYASPLRAVKENEEPVVS